MLNDRPCIVNLISSRNTGHPLSLQLPQLGEVFYRDQLTPEAAGLPKYGALLLFCH